MFSLSEGSQQSAPTAVALAAAAPAAAAVTGNRDVVSGRGIGGGTFSSAGDRRYCFSHCAGGGRRPGRPFLSMEQWH